MTLTELAGRVTAALTAGDLEGYRDLLAPDARWGPADEPDWGCHGRNEILRWFGSSRDKGMAARVDEVVVGHDCLLVGLTVSGTPGALEAGGTTPRWQVLAVRDGRIVDIRGFDNRSDAAGRAGIPA